uniref:Plant cysteine oxidase 4-like n=1 Tax=Rhizophora mucronata TaxID=61149 RepID=A0A2P2NMP5_RHIMU
MFLSYHLNMGSINQISIFMQFCCVQVKCLTA